jgi:drug/metabolite transporter (DMT)-like permease
MPFLYLEIVICFIYDFFIQGEEITVSKIIGSLVISLASLLLAIK